MIGCFLLQLAQALDVGGSSEPKVLVSLPQDRDHLLFTVTMKVAWFKDPDGNNIFSPARTLA